jgi:hypothetical protein
VDARVGVKRRAYAWREIVNFARARPGMWVQHRDLLDAPARTLGRIRGRNHPDLQVEDGAWEVRSSNEYEDEYGTRRCDIWLRFVPHSRVESPTGGQKGTGP